MKFAMKNGKERKEKRKMDQRESKDRQKETRK